MALQRKPEPPFDDQPFHAGDRIRKARDYIGVDRQTFAEMIGVHRDTLAKYEESGKAKRSVLISVAWNTPIRLEWLETGKTPWLKTTGDDHPVGPAGFEPTTSTVVYGRLAPVTPIRPGGPTTALQQAYDPRERAPITHKGVSRLRPWEPSFPTSHATSPQKALPDRD